MERLDGLCGDGWDDEDEIEQEDEEEAYRIAPFDRRFWTCPP
jgi:hypothetical protein